MNFRIYLNLRKERQRMNPSRKFKRDLWNRLENRMNLGAVPQVVWYHKAWFRTTGSMVAGFLTVASVGTGVYAYNSPEVTEGSMLYPVKMGIERIEETTKTNPQSKAKFLLKTMQRRQEERQVIITKQTDGKRVEDMQKVDDEMDHVSEKLIEVQNQLPSSTDSNELKTIIEHQVENWRHRRNRGNGNGGDENSNEDVRIPTSTPNVSIPGIIDRVVTSSPNNGRGNRRGNGEGRRNGDGDRRGDQQNGHDNSDDRRFQNTFPTTPSTTLNTTLEHQDDGGNDQIVTVSSTLRVDEHQSGDGNSGGSGSSSTSTEKTGSESTSGGSSSSGGESESGGSHDSGGGDSSSHGGN